MQMIVFFKKDSNFKLFFLFSISLSFKWFSLLILINFILLCYNFYHKIAGNFCFILCFWLSFVQSNASKYKRRYPSAIPNVERKKPNERIKTFLLIKYKKKKQNKIIQMNECVCIVSEYNQTADFQMRNIFGWFNLFNFLL